MSSEAANSDSGLANFFCPLYRNGAPLHLTGATYDVTT
jgi:hypothetical protein